MFRVRRISIILLFASLISSCATNRIQLAMRKDIECKTIETRYDYGRNKQIQPINSNYRKYTRYTDHAPWKRTHNGNSFKNITRQDKHPGNLNYGLEENKNYPVLTYSDKNEPFQQIKKSSEINLSSYKLRILPDYVGLNNEPLDIIIRPSQEDMPLSVRTVNNDAGFSTEVVNQGDIIEIIPDEFAGESSASQLSPAKSQQSQKSQNTPFQKSEIFILLMAALAGLIPLAIIKYSPNLASDISFWAAMNPWKTRIMFAGIQIGLGTAGFIAGESLADNGLHFSALSRDLLLGTFLFSSLLYPAKYSSINFKNSYLRQKTFDIALAISGFMLMVNAGNDPGLRASFTNPANYNGHELLNINRLNNLNPAPKQLLYYKNETQSQDDQTAVQKKETSTGVKVFLTTLVVLSALALVTLLAAAACGLYCNGMVGLAFLTGLGGGLLVITAAILLIKRIGHPKQNRKMKTSKITHSVQQEGTLQI